MTITKGAKRGPDAFAAEAPDAQPSRRMRGHKAQLTLTLPPDLIRRVDEAADRHRRSRASMVEIALDEWLRQDATRMSREVAA
jgi:hypothetical protein